MKELVGDVGENGSAARGDAALGDEDEKARQELPEVGMAPELGELRQEFGGELERITWSLLAGSLCGAQTEMVRTKTKLRFRAGKTAALAIGVAMLAAGGIAFRGERGAVSGEMGISLGWIHGSAP